MLSEAPSTTVEDEAAYDQQHPLRVLRVFGAMSNEVIARTLDDTQMDTSKNLAV